MFPGNSRPVRHAMRHLRSPARVSVRPPGFTLIEMLVVMTLIAMLLTLAVPRYFSALDNGRLNVQRQNVATIRDAIDKFFGDRGIYPATLDELVAKRYLRQVPIDPVSESANWVVIAPPDASLGAVYDVQPAPAILILIEAQAKGTE